MTANNSAILSNEGKYTVFTYGDTVIRFRTPDILERYEKVLEWDKANGYIVVIAIYNGVPTEEYIDLLPILDNLCIDRKEFLEDIERVNIA